MPASSLLRGQPQIDPGQVGGLRRAPAQRGKRLLQPLGDVGQIILQIVAQGVQPGFAVTIGGHVRGDRQHRRRGEAVAGFELLEVGFAAGIVADKAVGTG